MTEVAKHSEGPWFLEGTWDANAKTVGGWVSCFPPAGMPVFELVPGVGSKEQIIANANLIAAAPCLLKALKQALNFIENTETEIGVTLLIVNAARAAIAKAEGRS